MSSDSSTPAPIPAIDLGFRPASYWDHPDPVTAILGRIKGQTRRRAVRRLLTAAPEPATVPDQLLSESLSDEDRRAFGAIHPSNMGGEYLPDYLPGEAEIARIALRSVMYDVISVRAHRREAGGPIYYSLVDEYPEDGDYTVTPDSSSAPLTMGELIGLINTATKHNGMDNGDTLPDRFRNFNFEYDPDADALRHVVSVESDLYPDLSAWYDAQADAWYAQVRRDRGLDEAEDDI